MKPTLTLAMGLFLLSVTPSSAFELSRKGEHGKVIYLKLSDFSKFKYHKHRGGGNPPQSKPKSLPRHSVSDTGSTLALAMMGFGALALGARKLKK